jgi:hypothetical protein
MRGFVRRGPTLFDNSPSMDDSIITPNPYVSFALRNLGRTPAIVKELSFQLIQGEPGQRTFDIAPVDADEPVIDGGTESDSYTCSLQEKFLMTDGRSILDCSRPLYFQGHVVFATSFGREYTYYWRYESERARWVLAHYEEYESSK